MTLVAGGEGASKSWLFGIWAVANLSYLAAVNGVTQQEDGKMQAVSKLCWVVGYTFEDAYKDWRYVLEACEALDNIDGTPSIRDNGKQQCSFRTKMGQFVNTISGEDPTAVGRENVDLLGGAEASRWSSELFHRAQGRIERRANYRSAMFLSGSFESSTGPFFDWYKLGQGPNRQGLRSYSIPTWANRSLYPGGYDDPAIQRLRENNTADRFNERYGGHPAPPRNIVIPEFNTTLHVDPGLDWSETADTYIGVDPGSICYAWVMWQHVPEYGEVWVLDEGYLHRGTHEASIYAAKMSSGWRHCLRTRRLNIDVAGFQQHGNADTVAGIWRQNTGFVTTGKSYKVDTTIERLRSLLTINPVTGRARMRIHPRCVGLRAELGDGKNPIEGRGMWLRYNEHGAPRADSCDAVKALGYSLSTVFGTSMPDEGDEGEAGASWIGRTSRPQRIELGKDWKIV